MFPDSFLASGGCRQSLGFPGLQLHHPNLGLHHHMAFYSVWLCLHMAIFYFFLIYLFIFGCVGSSFLCEGFL